MKTYTRLEPVTEIYQRSPVTIILLCFWELVILSQLIYQEVVCADHSSERNAPESRFHDILGFSVRSQLKVTFHYRTHLFPSYDGRNLND